MLSQAKQALFWPGSWRHHEKLSSAASHGLPSRLKNRELWYTCFYAHVPEGLRQKTGLAL